MCGCEQQQNILFKENFPWAHVHVCSQYCTITFKHYSLHFSLALLEQILGCLITSVAAYNVHRTLVFELETLLEPKESWKKTVNL